MMQRKKMKPKSQLTFQGFLTVLGGFISHVHLGCIFIWGNIQPYVASYLKENDNELDTGQVFITLPIGIFAMTIGLYCGNKALRKMHPRVVYGIGAMINIIATFMTSYVKHLHAFLVLYGFIGGFGIGFAYIAPLFAAWLHFPDRKGFVSGIILAGFGFGVFIQISISQKYYYIYFFIYNLVTNELVNPNNLPPDAFLTSDSSLCQKIVYYYFARPVSEKIPRMWQMLSFFWFIHVIFGFLLINTPRRQDLKLLKMALLNQSNTPKAQKVLRKESVSQALKSTQFLLLFSISFFSLCYGYFLINAFKVYGQRNKFDDQFLSMVGSICLNFHFSFQQIYGLLLIKQFLYIINKTSNYFCLFKTLRIICSKCSFWSNSCRLTLRFIITKIFYLEIL